MQAGLYVLYYSLYIKDLSSSQMDSRDSCLFLSLFSLICPMCTSFSHSSWTVEQFSLPIVLNTNATKRVFEVWKDSTCQCWDWLVVAIWQNYVFTLGGYNKCSLQLIDGPSAPATRLSMHFSAYLGATVQDVFYLERFCVREPAIFKIIYFYSV